MTDEGHDFTDSELAKLKRRYDEAYSQAADEMAEKVTISYYGYVGTLTIVQTA